MAREHSPLDELDDVGKNSSMDRFNKGIAELISGTIEPLGDDMIPSDSDDEPDGGEFAILPPSNIPPYIGSTALKPNLETILT